MCEHEGEEDVVDVRFRIRGAGFGRRPVRRGYRGGDEGSETGGGGRDVRGEETGVDLGQDVADRFGFVGEFEGECGFEVRDEVGDCFRAEMGEVGEGEEFADVLDRDFSIMEL